MYSVFCFIWLCNILCILCGPLNLFVYSFQRPWNYGTLFSHFSLDLLSIWLKYANRKWNKLWIIGDSESSSCSNHIVPLKNVHPIGKVKTNFHFLNAYVRKPSSQMINRFLIFLFFVIFSLSFTKKSNFSMDTTRKNDPWKNPINH